MRGWACATGLCPAVATLCVLAMTAGPLAAQPAALEVRHTGADTLLVDSGGRGSVAFRITNSGATDAATRVSVSLPRDWRAAAPPAALELTPGSSAVRVLSFFPSSGAPAGAYPVVLTVRAATGAITADTVIVRVPAEPRLRVEPGTSPRMVTAGEPYEATFHIGNVGNVALPVRLVLLESLEDFEAHLDRAELRLDPGASTRVRVRVETPERLRGALVHPLRLRAVAPGDTAEAAARVEVVPRGRGPSQDRGGLPAELSVRLGQPSTSGPPVSLRASGPLAPGSKTRVDLLLRGPSQEPSVFGEMDAYRLGLSSPRFSLDLGDRVFTLSRLTEPGREGIGGEASVRAGPLELGGYGKTDRRSLRPDTQIAAYGALRMGNVAELRGNWLRSLGAGGTREVWTAQGRIRLPSWLEVSGEYGRRPSNASGARSVDVHGDAGPLAIRLRHLRVDSAYGGPYGGFSQNGAHLGLRSSTGLFVDGSFDDQRLRRRALTGPGDRSLRTARVALGYGSYVSLEGRRREATSPMGADGTDRTAHSGRIRLGLPLGAVALYPSFEAGIGDERRAEGARPFWRAGLRTEVRAGPASLSQSVEYFSGGSLSGSLDQEGVAAALSGSLRLAGGTRAEISAYGSHYLAPTERTSLVVNARLEQRLPFDHRVTARLLSRPAIGGIGSRETVVMVDYAIPLRLPVGRHAERPSTIIRVYDARTGEPRPGVVVEVGGRRIATDEHGRAVVTGLPPGPHYVDLDRATGGMSQVPVLPLPHRFEVRPDEDTTVDIGLTSSAGLVVLTELNRASTLPGSERSAAPVTEPFSRVLVDLTREGERIRRRTDEGGRLELHDLRPGQWTVTVAAAELPPFHRFEQDTTRVHLAAGEDGEITLRGVPIERRVRMVASGVLREGDADAQAVPTPPNAPVPAAAREPRSTDAPRPERAPSSLETLSADSSTRVQPGEPAPTDRWSSFRTSERTHRLMEVAREVYFETRLWAKIWVANRDRIPDPTVVPPGIILRIPPRGPLTLEERRAYWDYYIRPGG